jgi:nicotinamide mononucleotide transporter
MYSFAQRHLIDPNIRAFNPRTREGQANWLFAFLSVAFVILNALSIGPFTFSNVEVWGFVTGFWSVLLLAQDNVSNWPVGIINGAIFVWLFWNYHLYADASINMWYVVAGIYGWVFWMVGGKNRTERKIMHIPLKEFALVLLFIVALTWWEYGHLRHLGDTAPFLDGLTTAMSIGAFWMQARKYIENWWIWILADCIYIPLYFSKALPLTGVLYILFMATCFYGIYDWQRKLPGNSILARLTARRPTYSDSLYHGVVVGD